MEQVIFILLAIVGGVIIGLLPFLIFRIFEQKKKPLGEDKSILMLQEQLKEIRGTLDMKLAESHQTIQQQTAATTNLIKEITEELVRVGEGQKQVAGFADQLKNLQDILKNPKQRGVFGEYYLETLLKNAFQPKQYQMQYKFKDGEIVDAVLFVGEKIIPIDSKFSLENYNRIVEEADTAKREELENLFKQDLKKRIEETAKYIRPNEGTVDFAFMFIPAEGIYYDLLVNKVGAIKVNTRDLIDYAINEKRVHIVSPTTFYVTLQSMWQGMRAFQIQESTKEILKNIGQLEKHLRAYEDFHNKLGGHLKTAVNTYNSSSKEFQKIDKDFVKITGAGLDSSPLLLDKPEEM